MTKDEASWPTGQPHAVVINIMYEQWAPGTAPGLGPVGNPLPGGVLDYQALSWSEYGPHTGIWRLLELLDRFNAQASSIQAHPRRDGAGQPARHRRLRPRDVRPWLVAGRHHADFG